MESRIIGAIARKGANLESLAARVINKPETIPELIDGLDERSPTIKYGCEKVLRRVSEQRPDLVIPYFDVYAKLLDAENSFLKWGAILTLANLAPADRHGRLEKMFKKYLAPITGPDLITAGNTIAGASRIARAKPELTERVVKQILRVETAHFIHKGAPSPECRRVACGHAMVALDTLFEQIKRPKPVLEFVTRQLESTRPAVRKSAAKFLRRHATSAGTVSAGRAAALGPLRPVSTKSASARGGRPRRG